MAEIITVERRWRWSDDDKRRIVGEAQGPREGVSAVAKRYGLYPNQIRTQNQFEAASVCEPGTEEIRSVHQGGRTWYQNIRAFLHPSKGRHSHGRNSGVLVAAQTFPKSVLRGGPHNSAKARAARVVPHKMGGPITVENCVILCWSCHSNAHQGGRWRDVSIYDDIGDVSLDEKIATIALLYPHYAG